MSHVKIGTTTRATRPTWEELVELEPRLAVLEEKIKEHAQAHHRGDADYCANSHWYGYHVDYWTESFKGQMYRLVGFGRENKTRSKLNSMAAYDEAYEHLYNLLPDCRHDGVTCGLRGLSG